MSSLMGSAGAEVSSRMKFFQALGESDPIMPMSEEGASPQTRTNFAGSQSRRTTESGPDAT